MGQQFTEGTGLGLTISCRLTQLMGGDIAVQSILGQGSRFEFTLPVEIVTGAMSPSPRGDRPIITLLPDHQEYRILVVDDQPSNCLLLKRLLEPLGLSIREATTGEAALEIWQQWHPHLIWMDIRLPGMDGYEVTRLIRAYEQQQQRERDRMDREEQTEQGQSASSFLTSTVIIALTAQALADDLALAFAAGCDDYLSKPFQEADLLAKLAQHLEIPLIQAGSYAVASGSEQASESMLTPTHLAVMSRDWVKALYEASVICEGDVIKPLLQQVPPDHTALVHRLETLIYNFDFQLIMDVAAAYLKGAE